MGGAQQTLLSEAKLIVTLNLRSNVILLAIIPGLLLAAMISGSTFGVLQKLASKVRGWLKQPRQALIFSAMCWRNVQSRRL
jgi:hypothetical protein